MVLIFSEDGGLQIVDSQAEAAAQCEGIDVHSLVFWFYDGNGQALVPVFDIPVSENRFLWFFNTIDSGKYRLEVGDSDHPMYVDPLWASISETEYMQPNRSYGSLDQLVAEFRSRGVQVDPPAPEI